MEQDKKDANRATNKKTIGCFGWGLLIIFGLILIGTLFPESGKTTTQPAPSTTSTPTQSSTQPDVPTFTTSGCNTITSSIYEVTSKMSGLSTTYTIDDVAPVLLDAGEKWATWVEINKQDGNLKSALWLSDLSNSALKVRVALLEMDAQSLDTNGASLLAAINETQTYCP